MKRPIASCSDSTFCNFFGAGPGLNPDHTDTDTDTGIAAFGPGTTH